MNLVSRRRERKVVAELAHHFRDGKLKTHADLWWEADMWDSIGRHHLADYLREIVIREDIDSE